MEAGWSAGLARGRAPVSLPCPLLPLPREASAHPAEGRLLVAVHLQVRQQRMKLNGRDTGDVQTRSGVDGTAPMST